MSLTVIMLVLAFIFVYVIFFTKIGADYTKKTDRQLIDLWPLHKRNINAAKAAGPAAYKRAVEKSSTLTNEMKRRGLLEQDFSFDDIVLETMSQKMFSKSLGEIKNIAKSNNPEAIYQLGMMFHALKESDTSIRYIANAADLGHPDAQYALGWAFITQGSGVAPDKASSLMWFMLAAQHGHEQAKKALHTMQESCSRDEFDAATSEAKKWSGPQGRNAHTKD